MSALIFVAVAAAWAVYLVPKALRHHEEASASRTVEQVSERARVLARRDAVTGSTTALTTLRRPRGDGTTNKPASTADTAESATPTVAPVPAPTTVTPAQLRARRAAARRAAQRRRRVLLTLLVLLAGTVGLAVGGVIAMPWVAVPAGLIVAWLVTCRLMVRQERAAAPVRAAAVVDATADADATGDTGTAEQQDAADQDADETGEIVAVEDTDGTGTMQVKPDGTWEPVPVTLPTYVAKAPASRTVRTIDLDSTGVWSSGRNAADSELAREAEQERATQRDADKDTPRRATGS